MREIIKKVFAVILAILTAVGAFPLTEVPVFGASSYSLHKVNDLLEYARSTEADKMSYITNLTDSVVDVHNNDFESVYMDQWGGRTCICVKNECVPEKYKTASWKNVCTITFKNAGYTSDGKIFNLECTLQNIEMYGARVPTLLDNAVLCVADITSTGLISRAAFIELTKNGVLSDYSGYGTPRIRDVWKFRVTDSKGKTMEIPPIALYIKDLDNVAAIDDEKVREGFQAVSGFDSDVYVSSDTLLIISENNSKFEGDGLKETTDQRNQVLFLMNEPEAVIRWQGLTCGTHITPLSLTGYPVPGTDKTVDKTTAEAGESLHYTINTVFPAVTDDNAAKKIIVTDQLNDILDAENAVTHVYKDGADADGEWNLKRSGQTVTWTAKNPAGIQGSYRFTIDVKIRDDLVLDGREELYIASNGRVYYMIANSSGIEVTDQHKEKIVKDSDPVKTRVPVGGIALAKDVDRSKLETAQAGDSLNYSFTIENTGLVTLNFVELTDSLPVEELSVDWENSSDPASGSGTLRPYETVKGTAVYKVTQADIDSGLVHNTAAVSGKDDLGVEFKAQDDADTTLGQTPGIDLTKEALPVKAGCGVGDSVEYRFEIRNTGNTSLSNITFTDDHELKDLEWDREISTLLPGEKAAGSAAYTLTQEDVDAGHVLNTAVVTGKAPDGKEVTDTDDAETEIAAEPGICLEKSTDPAIRTNARAGDAVPFTFVITNTGNCSLGSIALEDALEGISDVVIDWNNSGNDATAAGVLSSGESVNGEAFYTLTQADIDAGSIENRAIVTGTAPSGSVVQSEDDANVLLPENGAIILVKVSEGEITGETKPGDIVRYDFTVTNAGNVTLTGVTILDDLEGIGAIQYDWDGSSDVGTPAGTLSPGEVVAAYAEYPITQDDIDAGQILNNATAVGKTPSGKDVTGLDDDLQPIPYLPEISLVKEVNIKNFENVKAGDTLNYTFTAANAGNCTLVKVTLIDELEGLGEIKYDWSGASEGEGILKPGEIVKASAVYTISQDDINSGSVTNTAEITGYAPDKTPVTCKASAETVLQQVGAITVTKTADTVKLTDAHPGDEIVYTMIAENTGNLTVSNVELTDDKEGLGDLDYDWTKASGEHLLEPGEYVTVHASYKITQEDIEQEKTDNTVIVTGRTPDGKEITPAEATVSTPIERKDSITVWKNADKSLISNAKAGEIVNYTFKVSNTGNTILHEVVMTDELAGLTAIEYDWSGASKGEGTLLPGESITAKASYAIVQADIDRGRALNTVSVTAQNGKDEPVGPAEDAAETKLGGKTAFSVVKNVDRTTITNAVAGDVLSYTITGTNTGEVTLTDVTLKDTLKGVTALVYDWTQASGGEGTLLPGESVTATCTYSVTQADISNGKLENTAIMSARNPEGTTSEKEVKITTTLKRQPTPTPTPVRVNGSTGTVSSGNPSTGNVTTNSRTVTGSSPAQTGGSTTYSRTGSVRTGDETQAGLWLLIALAAICVGGAILIRRRSSGRE